MTRNNNQEAVPLERRERNPLINGAGYRNFRRIQEHPAAPRWNYVVGDRLQAEDLPAVEAFREAVFTAPRQTAAAPPEWLPAWVRAMRERSPIFRERLPEGFDLERDWGYVPTMSREDLAVRPEDVVPVDADLSRLIVYDTSGTTGHALVVPSHPRVMAQHHALVEFALDRHGLKPAFGPDMVACINVCAQVYTVLFANVFTVWDQAGFAKVNLSERDWSVSAARRFFPDLAPFFLTGDPVGFAEMMRWGIAVKPAALLSTAVSLSPGLAAKLEENYGGPVIDWYSTTETGPLAYSCRAGRGLHLLAPDVYVEIIDTDGYPKAPGGRGELAVTAGRNPYLPLLRYRTGDFARLELGPCPCGDPAPRLVELEGRAAVFFRAHDGAIVNPVDLGRVLRTQALIQHEFIQRADRSFDLSLRPAPGLTPDLAHLERGLRVLLGETAAIRISIDPALGERLAAGKVRPYQSELDDQLD